jgi:hypothetical protein
MVTAGACPITQAARQQASAERRVGHQRTRLKIEYSDCTAAIG